MNRSAVCTEPRFSVDEAYRFTCRLHGDPQLINPGGWTVDWDDAPWPVKVYDAGVRWPLPGSRPPWWTLQEDQGDLRRAVEGRSQPSVIDIDRLGMILFSTAGAVAVRSDPGGGPLRSPERPVVKRPPTVGFRRAVPSGGGLYPAEIYVVATTAPQRVASFHYDVWRHELVDLALPIDAKNVAPALDRHDVEPFPLVLFVLTDRFWKNACKYGNFAYRLGAVDVGVVLGRLVACLQDVGPVEVSVDFCDAEVDRLVGVDGYEEASYAVVSLPATLDLASSGQPLEETTGAEVSGRYGPLTDRRAVDLNPSHSTPRRIERSRFAKIPPDLAAMHASAIACGRAWPGVRASSMGPHREAPGREPNSPSGPASNPGPSASDEANLMRQSVGHRFTGRPCHADAVKGVLAEASRAVERYRRQSTLLSPPCTELVTVVSRVNGLQPGRYAFGAPGGLIPLRPQESLGDALRHLLHAKSVNLELASFIVLVVGDLDFRLSPRESRQYRIEQMAAGVAIDALTTAATHYSLGSHPFLGFDASIADRLAAVGSPTRGTLAIVCVGHARPGPVLGVSLAPTGRMA